MAVEAAKCRRGLGRHGLEPFEHRNDDVSPGRFSPDGIPAESTELLERAERYLQSQGHIKGLKRRYGRDKTFAVPILTNCALAGMVPWRRVSPLPFELAALPQSLYRFLRLPVVSYAIPALVAIGQARFHHRPPDKPDHQMDSQIGSAAEP